MSKILVIKIKNKIIKIYNKFLIEKYIIFHKNINCELKKIYALKYFSIYKDVSSKINILYSNKKNVYYIEPKFKNIEKKYISKDSEGIEILLNLKECKIIGESNLILLNNKEVIYLIKDKDKENRAKYSDGALLKYDNKQNIFFIEKEKEKEKILNGIYLGGNYSYNYYHFLIEFITKFEILNKIKLDKNIPLIVDKNMMKISQFKELIDKFNVDKREIIYIDKNKIYSVEDLYYIDTATYIPPNLKNGLILESKDTLFDIDKLSYLRFFLASEIKKDNKYPQKIFLSRKNATNRRRFNENEVKNLLEKNGFITIYPETMSINEQINYFNNAKIIVGGGGGAFTNLLFCNNKCQVILLTNHKIKTSLFSILSYISKSNLIYLFDKTLNSNQKKKIHLNFKVDLLKLEKILREIEEIDAKK